MQSYGLVSIGSHSGIWLQEELSKYNSKKNILVEPVPYNIDQLEKNTKDFKDVIIERSAISDKNEIASFFYLKKESIDKLKKHWATGIGSFDKSHLLSHRSKRFQITDDDIEETKINCINFESLKKKYSIYKIEKLMIDVEGAEFKILNSINFGDIEIKEIFFEKKHFDGYMCQGKKFEEIKEKLKSYNYILKENLNSIESVSKLLKKHSNNIKLIAGDTNKVLKEINLQNIDFVFLDGGHSYQTVINDLTILYENMKGKKKVILCDDYGKESYIFEVEKAIKNFTKQNNLKLNLIENRFAEIIT